MKPAVLFDLDGTLWDASEGVAYAWNEVMEENGVLEKPVTGQDVIAYMGWPMNEIENSLFAAIDDPQRRHDLFMKCTERENEVLKTTGSVLYPEVKETLAALKKNFFVGIVSNCQFGYIESFLQAHDLQDAFDAWLCWGDTMKDKNFTIEKMVNEHDLSPVLYVGDIQKDADASHKAGVDFVLADWGFGQAENEPVVYTFADLIPYAENWLRNKKETNIA